MLDFESVRDAVVVEARLRGSTGCYFEVAESAALAGRYIYNAQRLSAEC